MQFVAFYYACHGNNQCLGMKIVYEFKTNNNPKHSLTHKNTNKINPIYTNIETKHEKIRRIGKEVQGMSNIIKENKSKQ